MSTRAPADAPSVIDVAAYERARAQHADADGGACDPRAHASPEASLHFGHRTLLAALVWMYAAAALGDAWTTWIVLEADGLAREANPLMREAMAFYGLEPVLVMRVVVGVALAWLLARVSLRGYILFRLPREHPSALLRRGDGWYRARARVYAVYLVVGTAITWLVVGSNLRAALEVLARGAS